ncbi:hypothetical protein QEH52_12055 [Coraliomargarita sp. SDUM461003]|uniref:CotH protein n=1 Tax=Thalassobacterium maritimum TaxID=3041265 RepID=A0ABU1AXC2_9BACT|nr:hypothetical protein [Coraliomargarita sp. SDUM461003]MDQ8208247.1 hypothetical protein [Coraliomargarita sp. SDUM461003]
MDIEIHDENGNPQIATEDNPANVPANGDFDEEKQVNGRYVRDYEDANLEFATESNDLKTDDLRGCVVNVPGFTDDIWQMATLKVRKKAGVIDPETNEEEAEEIRMHAIDGSNNWVEVPLDTDLAPDYYVSTGQYADYDSCWIEGIKDGPITIEVEIVINGGTPILVEKKVMICTEKTKAEWQQEVWDDIQLVLGVDASTFDPNNSFIDNNDQLEAIYNYYGETFLRDDENYIWPGLGKLAGASVYGGLVDAELGKTYASIASFFNEFFPEEVDELIDLTSLALDEIQGILMGGANDIFKDLAWQFKAYHTSGLCAINYVFDEEGSLLVDVDVWGNIDEGVNGANTFLSGIGNRDIADREQNTVIQPTFSLLDQRGWEPLFSFLATNPVLGAPMFKDSAPGGEITDAADRWNWVLNDMWYLYTGTPVHTQRDWASESIYELSKPHARTY